jgi:hypothetical protein
MFIKNSSLSNVYKGRNYIPFLTHPKISSLFFGEIPGCRCGNLLKSLHRQLLIQLYGTSSILF